MTRRAWRKRGRVAALAAVAALLSGCAPAGAGVAAETAAPGEPAEPRIEASEAFWCAGYEVTAETLAHPRRATDLDAGWFELLRTPDGSAGFFDDVVARPEAWSVLVEDEGSLVLMSQVSLGALDGRLPAEERLLGNDHGYFAIGLNSTGNMAMPIREGTNWELIAGSGCRLTSDRALPAISLDPENPPAPDDTELHLLVIDHDCGGFEGMPERIEVRRLTQTSGEIGLLLGVRPRPADGAGTCEGFPPAPYTVALDAPLGERAILDLSRPEPQWDMRAALAAVARA